MGTTAYSAGSCAARKKNLRNCVASLFAQHEAENLPPKPLACFRLAVLLPRKIVLGGCLPFVRLNGGWRGWARIGRRGRPGGQGGGPVRPAHRRVPERSAVGVVPSAWRRAGRTPVPDGLLPQILLLGGVAGLVGGRSFRCLNAQLQSARVGPRGGHAPPGDGQTVGGLARYVPETCRTPRQAATRRIQSCCRHCSRSATAPGEDIAARGLDRPVSALAFQFKAIIQRLPLRLPAGMGLFKGRLVGRGRLCQHPRSRSDTWTLACSAKCWDICCSVVVWSRSIWAALEVRRRGGRVALGQPQAEFEAGLEDLRSDCQRSRSPRRTSSSRTLASAASSRAWRPAISATWTWCRGLARAGRRPFAAARTDFQLGLLGLGGSQLHPQSFCFRSRVLELGAEVHSPSSPGPPVLEHGR